jgi:hypothetical protein
MNKHVRSLYGTSLIYLYRPIFSVCMTDNLKRDMICARIFLFPFSTNTKTYRATQPYHSNDRWRFLNFFHTRYLSPASLTICSRLDPDRHCVDAMNLVHVSCSIGNNRVSRCMFVAATEATLDRGAHEQRGAADKDTKVDSSFLCY